MSTTTESNKTFIREAQRNSRLVRFTLGTGEQVTGQKVATVTPDRFQYDPWFGRPSGQYGSTQANYADVTNLAYDYDAEREQREHKAQEEAREVAEAYKVISRSLNVMGGDADSPLLEALRSEHPTLLGKLANVVLAAVDERRYDGRITVLAMTLGDIIDNTGWDRDTRVSELRQPLI